MSSTGTPSPLAGEGGANAPGEGLAAQAAQQGLLIFFRGWIVLRHIRGLARDRVAVIHPFAQVEIGAAFRAEGFEVGMRRLAADRAFHHSGFPFWSQARATRSWSRARSVFSRSSKRGPIRSVSAAFQPMLSASSQAKTSGPTSST